MDIETSFGLVTNDCRRAVVAVLHETSPISRERLTARLAAQEGSHQDDTGREELDRTTRRRIRIALHHNHLPRLADKGIIEYDDELVAATPELEALVDHMEPSRRNPARAPGGLGDHLAAFYA
jgi:hypothetical protein